MCIWFSYEEFKSILDAKYGSTLKVARIENKTSRFVNNKSELIFKAEISSSIVNEFEEKHFIDSELYMKSL